MGGMKESGVEWIGEIPEEWEIKRLKDCLAICNGREVESEDGSIPVYGSGGVFKWTDKALCNETSILFGRKGTIDKPLYVEEPFWTVDTMFYSISKGVVDLHYLYLLATCFKYDYYLSGSTLPSMTQTDLGSIYVPFPERTEQRLIAEEARMEASSIDKMTDLLVKQIDVLERYKKSLIHEAVTKGLDPDVAMKPSGVEWIGDIPEHWKTKRLKYIFQMQSGDNITAEDIEESGDYPVFGGNGLRGYAEKCNVHVDSILIGRQGALCGNVHFVQAPFWASDHAIVVYNTTYQSNKYFYYLLTSMNLNKLSMTAAQPGISVENVLNQIALLPPLSEQQEIADYLDEKCAKVDSILGIKCKQIEVLKKRRQSLIYEYVTGKRRVEGVQ